uniref:HD2 AMF mating type protein n=2 Tax=Rhizophagus irregularis TaxID=588596 RepID=A0A141W353_9GLOM|nr:HD2 AMF mating type protein [Rhizophagus irregularis]AMM62675.1 HD2 AMF mating type protein [Rhizophagus irregularis]
MELNVQTLKEIQIKLSKFIHCSNSNSSEVVNLPIRKKLFDQFYKSSYNDESQFISLFQNQVSVKLVEPNIDNTLFENICDNNCKDLRIKIHNMYCKEIEKVRNVLEQKCQKQKLTLLQSYFILPNGGSEHVQEILAKIDKTFSFMISKIIHEFQNIVLHKFTELHIIRYPVKVDIGSRFTGSTKQILEAFYVKNNRPSNYEKIELSHQTELTVKQIETWFNNRRNREEKDFQEFEACTERFLRNEMDWEKMFNAIESGKETSKDMIIFTTAALGLSNEIKETTNKSIEVYNNNNDETTSSSHNSLVIRSRVTRGSHKSTAAPYTKQTPMVTKITKTRSNIKADASPENPIQISVKDSQHSSSMVITSNKLKHRPSKLYSRDKAHPYRRADKQKCLNSSPPNAIVKTYDIDEYCSSWQMNTNEYESPSLSSLTDFLQNQFTDPINNTFNYYHDNNFVQYNFNDTQSSEIHDPHRKETS